LIHFLSLTLGEISQKFGQRQLCLVQDEMINEPSVFFPGPVEQGASSHDLFPQPTAFIEDCIDRLFLYQHGADEDIVSPLKIAAS
jgi:hypothetical protein